MRRKLVLVGLIVGVTASLAAPAVVFAHGRGHGAIGNPHACQGETKALAAQFSHGPDGTHGEEMVLHLAREDCTGGGG